MFRKPKRSPYDEFLAKYPEWATFADRVMAQTAALSRTDTPEEFRGELEKLNSSQAQPQGDTPEGLLRRLGPPVADEASVRRMALVCRAVEVSLGKTPWHHQIICGFLLTQGLIVELPNGAGKSIAALLAAGFNSTCGKTTHIVTANDYLAERDTRELGPAYQLLGLRVGIVYTKQTPELDCGILEPDGRTLRVLPADGSGLAQIALKLKLKEQEEQSPEPTESGDAPDPGGDEPDAEPVAAGEITPEDAATPGPLMSSELKEELLHSPLAGIRVDPELTAKEVFACPVVYGQIPVFGFAYLRDNQTLTLGEQVLSKRDLLIVDECDTVLLDDLRQPLVITGTTRGSGRSLTVSGLHTIQRLASCLTPGVDFEIAGKEVWLTYQGVDHVRELTGTDIFRSDQVGLALALVNALKAMYTYSERVDYLVRNGQVIIVDQRSGRLLADRRFGEGLHEALEIKEGFAPEGVGYDRREMARITYKYFVRVYRTLSGMSGAIGAPDEYMRYYGLECLRIQPDLATRHDYPDIVYRTRAEAVRAVVHIAIEQAEKGRPVLVNVPAIRDVDQLREHFAEALAGRATPVLQSLDARSVGSLGDEAEKIQLAGEAGVITICSKVAARGTDIKLDAQALANGGLYVIGLERSDVRRYDDQLRGRAGRHGQPGESVFILSLEDPLMALFGGPRMMRLMLRLGMEEDVPVESDLITRRIEAAQRAIQRRNRDATLQVVEFDDVMARHRTVYYSLRQRLLGRKDLQADLEVIVANWAMSTARNLPPASSRAFGGNQSAVLGRLARFFDQVESDRVLMVRNRKARVEVLRRTVAEKIAESKSDEQLRVAMLTGLDQGWWSYLEFEEGARDEVHLYEPGDPVGFERYARSMEERFDSFFYEVGETVLESLLETERAWRSWAAGR